MLDSEMDTLYARFGGPAAVSRMVFAFYDRVLRSERLSSYFAGVDMRRLVEHQAKFLSSVMGGPASYTNAQLREVHAHLTVDDAAFDEMVDLLTATLREFGLPPNDVDVVVADIRARRSHITRPGKVPLNA
jgi:hemoglobin